MRRFLWALFAVVILATTIVVAAPQTVTIVEAAPQTRLVSTGLTDDPDHWAYSAAEWTRDGCVDIQTSVMGQVNTVLAPLSGKTVHYVKDPVTGNTTASYEIPPNSSSELKDEVLYRSKKGDLAKAQGEVDAATEYKNWAIDQKSNNAPWVGEPGGSWDDVINAQEQRRGTALLEVERINGELERMRPNGKVGDLRLNTVGTNDVPANLGDSETKVSKGGGVGGVVRWIGQKVIIGGSGPVGLVVATAVGGVCGGIKIGSAVFGDPWYEYDGPMGGSDSASVVKCSDLDGVVSLGTTPVGSDLCLYVEESPHPGLTTWNSSILLTDYVASRAGYYPSAVGVGHRGPKQNASYADQWRVTWPFAMGVPAGLVVACTNPEYGCGLLTTSYSPAGVALRPRIAVQKSGGYTEIPIVGLSDQGGKPGRLRAYSECKNVGSGVVVSHTEYSIPFWDSGTVPPWPDVACSVGEAPIALNLSKERPHGGGFTEATWPDGYQREVALDWALPNATRNNSTTLGCLAVGATSCDTVPKPGDPSKVLVGGPGGLEAPADDPTTRDAVDELFDLYDLPESQPDYSYDGNPEDRPKQPTTADPETDECSDGICMGDPPGGVSADEASCWPRGWGWLNPVSWVLQPIKCALVWAFWDQTSANEISGLMRDNGWTDLLTESSFTTDPAAGPCIDMDVAEICSSSVLGVTAPDWVSLLLGAVITFFGLFEVIGLFARITHT